MNWFWFVLLVPALWVAWQAIKVLVGVFAPIEGKVKGAILHHLKAYGLGRDDLGEEALAIFTSRTARMAEVMSRALRRPLAEELWGASKGQAMLIVMAVFPQYRSDYDSDKDFKDIIEVLEFTKSPLLTRLPQRDPRTQV
ncbi:hypothetical protein [Marinicauda sp. Alg238-R41]|uniref:hypothetical protein n=1 Tax=Marinicauda sp. Alg238-R41 TaxID=2993447 RepID=UPI0022E48A95|nr:hypothetical protein [Marinicauda sp. Alg238-R41]